MICTGQKIRFQNPEWSICWKICFHYTERLLLLEKSRKWFPRAGKCFSVKIKVMVSNSRKKALNKSILFSLGRNKFPLAGTKGSLFSIHVKVTFGGSNVWKIEGNDFHQPEIKFILAVMRCCINNLFLQNRAAVARHKRRCFLKDISTRREICFTSSNKDFLLTLVCH